MNSAAHIQVPEPQPADFFNRLKRLIAASGNNRNEQAIAAITACILENFDTTSQIMDMLIRVGFNRRHAGAILTKSTGADPDRDRWSLDKETQRYTLHPQSPVRIGHQTVGSAVKLTR